MSAFRYHRMACNRRNWQRPHSGRMNKDPKADYLGQTGYGHEDWNFSKEIWKDGLVHLYLKQRPAKPYSDEPIKIVLGEYREGQNYVVGFAENVTTQASSLPEPILKRRARELSELAESARINGAIWRSPTLTEAKDDLRLSAGNYWAAVNPEDLIVLTNPVALPEGLYHPPSQQYILYKLKKHQYEAIREYAFQSDLAPDPLQTADGAPEEAGAEEGRRLQRIHIARERSASLVKKAKDRFIRENGNLFCEACGLEPAKHYGVKALENRVIEAHHDVPLSSYERPCLMKTGGSVVRRDPLPATPFMAGSGGGWIEEAWVFRTVSE